MAESGGKKRLGRGLAALIGDMEAYDEAKTPQGTDQSSPAGSIVSADRKVAIELIRANPNNPRRQFSEDQLRDLAVSIAEHGIVQPILVRPVKGEDLGGAQYEIIAGERRWRAAQKAALHEVPVLIRDVADKQALELAIIENVQRADLNPLEEAKGYQQLIDEYDYSQSDLGNVIGKSRSHVANTLRLLKLPSAVQKMVVDGEISAGHARALVTSDHPESLAREIVKKGLSVRQVEELVSEAAGSSGSTNSPRTTFNVTEKTPDIKALENQIEVILGITIDIRHKDNGKGEIRLKYSNLEQLETICRQLQS